MCDVCTCTILFAYDYTKYMYYSYNIASLAKIVCVWCDASALVIICWLRKQWYSVITYPPCVQVCDRCVTLYVCLCTEQELDGWWMCTCSACKSVVDLRELCDVLLFTQLGKSKWRLEQMHNSLRLCSRVVCWHVWCIVMVINLFYYCDAKKVYSDTFLLTINMMYVIGNAHCIDNGRWW